MCELTNVSYRFPNAADPILRDLSFSMRTGEHVAMMGANGSGKSTLALLMAGLLQPESGYIRIDEAKAMTLPVGVLFQNPDVQLVAATVERDIALGLENLGASNDEMRTRVTEILERFQIRHLRERTIADLSGGEKVRVALAGVMITRPKLLVLDEPDSYLDETGKRILMAEIERLRTTEPEIAVLHITQYRHIADYYPRLLLLKDGAIGYDGLPTNYVYDVPDTEKINFSGSSAERRILRVNELSFSYTDTSLIHNLSFELESGSVLAVVGGSGSGKSTLGMLLAGLLTPDNGTIEVDEVAQGADSPVTMLFQFPEKQFFLPTCRAELAFAPMNHGRPVTSLETDYWLSTVGLSPEQFAERDPVTLSGGEKRRLACALPFGLSARSIIFDEPTAGLDHSGVARFLELVHYLKARGKGVLIISHDGTVVEQAADSVLCFAVNGVEKLSTSDFFASDRWREFLSPPDARKS